MTDNCQTQIAIAAGMAQNTTEERDTWTLIVEQLEREKQSLIEENEQLKMELRSMKDALEEIPRLRHRIQQLEEELKYMNQLNHKAENIAAESEQAVEWAHISKEELLKSLASLSSGELITRYCSRSIKY